MGEPNNNSARTHPYDHTYKAVSVLTRLRFRLKKEITDEKYNKHFDVTLYPNSVFVIPLSTNRIYTHEIMPSELPIENIPTRMGYVARCSNTNAVFKDEQTYIVKCGKLIPLEKQTTEGVKELKNKYFAENTTIKQVEYDGIYFSLNEGDYTKPLC